MPRSAIARTNVEDILDTVSGTKLEVAYFATIEEARQWLTRPRTLPPINREAESVT
jgi:hypothetical protein